MPERRDLAIAGGTWACAVAALGLAAPLAASDAEASVPDAGDPAWWVLALLLTTQAVLLLRARRAPLPTLLGVSVAAPVAALAGARDATGLTLFAVIVATYLATTSTAPRRRPAVGAAAALVAVGGLVAGLDAGTATGAALLGALVQAVGTLGLTVLVATVVSTRQEAGRARRERLEALEREQQALVQVAVAHERTAMARELHDIAAHHLSGIAVMAAAIGTQVDSDPAGAKASAQEVRRQSTAVLRDLRRLVGLLREGDPTDGTRPETVAGIAALVGESPGVVALTVLEGPRPLGDRVGPLAQLTAYRMVQESLANARRHAPGADVEVVVDDTADDRLVLTVRNTAAPSAGPSGDRAGFGLVGMRERAELTGSELDAGPAAGGGWQVVLRIPRDPVEGL